MKKLNYTELGKLVERAKAGDQIAFGAIYAATYEAQYYLALQILRNPEDAEDVLQETYLRLFRSLDRIETPQAMIAYLNKINYNQCLTLKDKLSRKAMVSSTEEYRVLPDSNPDHDPVIHLETKMEEDDLSELLFSMPEELRVILILRYVEDLKLKDISSVLGISLSTVKRHLHSAKKSLAKLLEQTKGGLLVAVLLNKQIVSVFAESQARLAPSAQTAGSILKHTFSSLSMPELSLSACKREAASVSLPRHSPAAKAAVAACTAGFAVAGSAYALRPPDLQIHTSHDLSSQTYISEDITASLEVDSPVPLKSIAVYDPDSQELPLTKTGDYSYQFTVAENGIYTLRVVSQTNSVTERTIRVSCIDKEAPMLADYQVIPEDSITVYFNDHYSGIDWSSASLCREDGTPVDFVTDSNNNFIRFAYTTDTLYLTVYDNAGNALRNKVSTTVTMP